MLSKTFSLIANLSVPERCICGDIIFSQQASLCQKCWSKLEFCSSYAVCECCGYPFEYQALKGQLCAGCIEIQPEFDKARSVLKYNDESASIISQIKYGDKTPYIKIISNLMSAKLYELKNTNDFDIVTCVPISNKKLFYRKFNQASLIALKISKNKNLYCNNLLFSKSSKVLAQASLSRKERLHNIVGAISINKKYSSLIIGKKILLVDDVITTGATINECAKILKKYGAKEVMVITAARTILEK
jgi:ComF family protein